MMKTVCKFFGVAITALILLLNSLSLSGTHLKLCSHTDYRVDFCAPEPQINADAHCRHGCLNSGKHTEPAHKKEPCCRDGNAVEQQMASYINTRENFFPTLSWQKHEWLPQSQFFITGEPKPAEACPHNPTLDICAFLSAVESVCLLI